MKKSGKRNTDKLTPAQLKLLERLCTAAGVTGDEGEVRSIILEELREYFQKHKVDAQVRVDALGSVLVTLLGSDPGPKPRVMIAAHMDEIGLMITADDGKGFFRFDPVGGIDPRQLPGKAVLVGKDKVPGVIGAKPIHLVKADELKSSISIDSLRIDIGPGGGSVKVGDRAVFATPFVQMGPSLRARALDNRLGVSVLIELLKGTYPQIDLYAAFTVQEEVGARGAIAAAYQFDPDLAVALDSTPAFDLPLPEAEVDPYLENASYNTCLGGGPAIYTTDSGTLSDPRLIRFFAQAAESAGIPFQLRQPGGGGTDAGGIHKQRAGIPSVSISVPSRYQHTSASICRMSDWLNTLALFQAALPQITPALLSRDRS